LEQRVRMKGALTNHDPRRPGPTVVLTGAPSIPPAAISLVSSALDSVWSGLGLEETKIGVLVVIELASPSADRSTSAPQQEAPMYLEPDSTDRATCVALVPAGRYWSRVMLGEPMNPRWRGQFVRWLKASLGPCAFYAMYGAPSRTVGRWLATRGWDVGRFLSTEGPLGAGWSPADLLGDPRYSWYWERIYMFSPATVACMAGRPAGCRAAVLRGASGGARADSLPRFVRVDQRRWWQTQDLIPGERYLSDVARAVGRERFLGFWGSPLPVDTSLALALRKPVGEWTAEWQHRYTPRLRLGAAAPVWAYGFAVLLTALVLCGAAVTAQRRQIQ
jgi:hypothetical protein